jgi:hypothetical protein
MWQKFTNIHCANTAKSFKCYLYFLMTTEMHSPQTEWAHWMNCFIFVTEYYKHILQHVPKFWYPTFNFWWVMVEQNDTYSQPGNEQFFNWFCLYLITDFWICVFILNNYATYCFCLHGSHTSTFIANISLVWRRMGLWKYKMCVARCCQTKVRHGLTWVLT